MSAEPTNDELADQMDREAARREADGLPASAAGYRMVAARLRLAAYDATAGEPGDEQVSWEVEDDIGWIDPGYASEEAARSAAVDYQAAAPDAGPHYVVKAVTRRTRTRFPVAAGGATPDPEPVPLVADEGLKERQIGRNGPPKSDPTERVWRCALRAANDWDDCCTAHDRHHPDFGCGWVPSEEGTTPPRYDPSAPRCGR